MEKKTIKHYKKLIYLTERLKESEKKYKTIVDNVNEAIIIHDFNGKIIEFNKNLCSMTGYSKEEIGRMKLKQIICFDEPFHILNDKLKRDISMLYHSYLVTKKQMLLPISVSSKLVSSENNGIIQLFIRNISELKKLEQQLIHSEKIAAVGQLAAGVAHEFNNILAIIYGNVQVTLKYESTKQEMIGVLKIIEEQAKRASVIVNDMLRFATVKPLKKELFNVSDIMDKVIEIQKNNFELENIKISKVYKSKNKAYVDFDQIQQVFLNIIINARHAILPKNKGKISISIKDENDIIVIKISDDGIGMDDEIKKNIFNPFFTTKGAHTKDELGLKGSGLGLTISYSIIKNHNGNIKIESKPGIGSSFTIEIPVYNENIKKVEKKEPEVLGKNHCYDFKILVIDDELEILSLMKKMFLKLGYNNCDCVENSKNLEKLIKLNKYDLVFLDIFMPKLKGDRLFDMIKKIRPDLPVVFISGQNESTVKVIKNLKYSAYLKKPFEIETLEKLVNKIFFGKKIYG
ncbi:response regulator [Candidatus Dependentiae bacterium]|nr:response regulator [Candidatus Dependentiae bacterium]